MRIVISASGTDLDSPISPNFGRCSFFAFVEPETLELEVVPNPAAEAMSGAGILAAQFIVGRGVDAVVTEAIGPNAFEVLQAASVPVFSAPAGTVRGAAQAYRAAHVTPFTGPPAGAHAGRRGRGRGCGPVGGWDRGRGRGAGRGVIPLTTAGSTSEEELSALQAEAQELREQLKQVEERIEHLEKE